MVRITAGQVRTYRIKKAEKITDNKYQNKKKSTIKSEKTQKQKKKNWKKYIKTYSEVIILDSNQIERQFARFYYYNLAIPLLLA